MPFVKDLFSISGYNENIKYYLSEDMVMKKYDVAVVGGGFAGACAAISAAREGAKVLLIDKSNALGGAAVNCLVNPFMRSYYWENDKTVHLSRGIFLEIRERLCCPDNGLFSEEDLKMILLELAESAGVQFLFHSYLCGVDKDGEKITSLSFATIGGIEKIEADYFIDATGDAQLSFLAGCPTTLGREPDHLCQPMTLCFRIGNVDVKAFRATGEELQKKYKAALERGEFINPRENLLIFNTTEPNVLHLNTTRVVKKNPTSAWDVTEAEVIARKQVYEVFDFLKKNADGMENAFISSTAAEIGVRESRMIIGDYVLTEADCKALTKFEDRIAACNYDIDIHNPEGSGTSHYYFEGSDFYTIPYRSLIPKEASNMLVAGRCISSDHGAQASYRIMPTVCSIGEAAGTAIAIAIKDGCAVREIDVEKLQKTLVKNGAYIGD